MIKYLKGGILAVLFYLNLAQGENFVLLNEDVLNEKVVSQINTIGAELYAKSGVFAAVAVARNIEIEELQAMQDALQAPFVLLVLSQKSHIVDILTSKEAIFFFDRNKVLSPYSGEGSILPVLASNKAKDIYNAAILNGYGDIADQIAAYFKLKLESSIGNANRDTLNVLRIGIYGFLCIAALYYAQRKIKKRRYAS